MSRQEQGKLPRGHEELRGRDRIWADRLAAISRFSEVPKLHPTNLLVHVVRTQALATDIALSLRPYGIEVDMLRLIRFSQHHDDPEILVGDIPTPRKRAMTEEERFALRREEEEAVVILGQHLIPQRYQELYRAYQQETMDKATVAAQIVDVADKLEAACDSIHELRCGNEAFIPVLERYHEILAEFYNRYRFFPLIMKGSLSWLGPIPSPQEVLVLPIRPNDLDQSHIEFYNLVLYPSLPRSYHLWVTTTAQFFSGDILPFNPEAKRGLFPGWYPDEAQR